MIAVLLLVVGLIYFAVNKFLVVKKISWSLSRLNCVDTQTLQQAGQIYLGKNLISLDEKSVENDFKRRFICIAGIKLEKKLPDELKIDVRERMPIAMVLSSGKEASEEAFLSTTEATSGATLSATIVKSSGSSGYLIDSEGVLFEKTGALSNFPKLFLNSDLRIGKNLSEYHIDNVIKILNDLKSLGINVSSAVLTNNDNLLVSSSPKVLFNLSEDISRQLGSLQLILGQAKIDKESVKSVDLRFDKPVVEYAPKSK